MELLRNGDMKSGSAFGHILNFYFFFLVKKLKMDESQLGFWVEIGIPPFPVVALRT